MGIFGGNNFTGFNPEEIKGMSSKVQQSANEVSDAIVTKLKNGVITPISKAWYTQEGVEFFNSFAETVKQAGTSIEEIFNSFITSLESAGNNWTAQVGSTESISLDKVSGVSLNLDVSEIQNNHNGDQGIIEADATLVASKLSGVHSEIENELKRIASNLRADTAFLGHNQAEAVTACFEKLSTIVSKVFDFLTTGEVNLQSEINKAVEKYGTIATETASAFNNAQ